VQVFLPKINDGTGTSVAVGKSIRVQALSSGPIEVLTNGGRSVCRVTGRRSVVVNALAGTVQGEPDSWDYAVSSAAPATVAAAAPAGGVGAAAGGWDTAAHRDAAIATINAILAAVTNAGLMKAE
jgi:hypothetical protein